MIDKETEKIRHNVPELSEWADEDISILARRVQTLKSQWRKSTSEHDTFLTLGAALKWSEKSHKEPGLPELNKTPSEYIELGQRYREEIKKQARDLADKAQAWGGFWDPEDEKKEDSQGWKERGSSIAPHVWIGLKKRGFLPHINTPLDYERESLQGLENCCALFLKLPKLSPNLSTLQRAHQAVFKKISSQAGEITDAQLSTSGYIGADPRLIPAELDLLNKQFEKGMKTARRMENFKDAEIIRTVAFTCARLLRIQPFKAGNKRIIAAWALCTLAREVSIPTIQDVEFFKNLHHTFKDLRKGKLDPTAKNLCKAFGVKNPEKEVPSFWLSPDFIAPKQIEPMEWENGGNHSEKFHSQPHKVVMPKKRYKEGRTKQRDEELEISALEDVYNLQTI